VVAASGGVVVGWPGDATIAEVSLSVWSETEFETLNDTLGVSPRVTLENATVEISIDQVFVGDQIVELLVSPVAIDEEVVGELVSMELDDVNGNPSVPVRGRIVLPFRLIGNPPVPVLSDIRLLDEVTECVSDETESVESQVEREEKAGSPVAAGNSVELIELPSILFKAVESVAELVCELSSVKSVVQSTTRVVFVLVFVTLNG
jgi:hypothetical protein